MRRPLVVVTTLLCLGMAPLLVQAQENAATNPTNPGQFYREGRAAMDSLILNRQVGDVIASIRGLDRANPAHAEQFAELEALNEKMVQAYPQPFQRAGLIRSEVLGNGFRQELIGYWGNGRYFYVYMLLHTEDRETRPIDFRYSDDFNELNKLF